MALPPDVELIENLTGSSSRRSAAEAAFYHQYKYFIEEGQRKYNLPEPDSFSAYSDAVLSVIQNLRQQKFDGRSALKTYLYQIFSNKCVDLIRHNTTNKEQANRAMPVSDLLLQLPDNARSVMEKLMSRQQSETIRQQLENIGDKCRRILLLFEEGMTDRQIAEEMEYQNAAVVKTTRLRCLDKLKEKVQGVFR